MAELYPLALDLHGRGCLVVGAGPVACRKVTGLERTGAVLTVVAPRAAPTIAEGAAAGRWDWHRRGFRDTDLAGQVLVFAATADPAVNRQVADAARRRGAWVNRADDPAGCDFHVPATVRRGAVTVAVTTAGTAPALAAWTRDRVGAGLPPALAELAGLVGGLRRHTSAAAEAFRALLAAGVDVDLERGEWPAVERKVMEHFGEGEAVRRLLHGLRSEGR